jgi:hypothetical protein
MEPEDLISLGLLNQHAQSLLNDEKKKEPAPTNVRRPHVIEPVTEVAEPVEQQIVQEKPKGPNPKENMELRTIYY